VDTVHAEAGEAHVVGIADVIEGGQVELGHRAGADRTELIDPLPHPAGHDTDLIGCTATDRVEQLGAQQDRQAALA
jgi:hypothetical protein